MSWPRNETNEEKELRFVPYTIIDGAAELAIDMQRDCNRMDHFLPLYFVVLEELCSRQGSDIDLSEIPKLFEEKYGYKLQLDSKLCHVLRQGAFHKICSLNSHGPPRKISPSPTFFRIVRLQYQQEDVIIKRLNEAEQRVKAADEKVVLLTKSLEARPEDKLTKMLSDELTCVVCLDTLNEAVESECCKTLCCQTCSTSLPVCPICRQKDAHWRGNEAIRRLVGKIPVKCDTKECTAWSTRAEIKLHKDHCEYVEIKCSNKECTFTAKRKDFKPHIDTCQHAMVNCTHCHQQIMKKNVAPHESMCAERTIRCTVFGCSVTVKAKDMPQHHEVCDFVALRCTNDGCTFTVQRQNMKDHLSKCPEGVLKCTYCTYKFKRKTVHSHERGCSVNYVQCWCGDYIRKRDIRAHRDHCPQAPIACRNDRCPERIIPRHMDTHVNNQCDWTYMPCRWNDCPDQFTRKFIQQHESNCWYRDVSCRHCGLETSRNALDDHLRACKRRRRYSPYLPQCAPCASMY